MCHRVCLCVFVFFGTLAVMCGCTEEVSRVGRHPARDRQNDLVAEGLVAIWSPNRSQETPMAAWMSPSEPRPCPKFMSIHLHMYVIALSWYVWGLGG